MNTWTWRRFLSISTHVNRNAENFTILKLTLKQIVQVPSRNSIIWNQKLLFRRMFLGSNMPYMFRMKILWHVWLELYRKHIKNPMGKKLVTLFIGCLWQISVGTQTKLIVSYGVCVCVCVCVRPECMPSIHEWYIFLDWISFNLCSNWTYLPRCDPLMGYVLFQRETVQIILQQKFQH